MWNYFHSFCSVCHPWNWEEASEVNSLKVKQTYKQTNKQRSRWKKLNTQKCVKLISIHILQYKEEKNLVAVNIRLYFVIKMMFYVFFYLVPLIEKTPTIDYEALAMLCSIQGLASRYCLIFFSFPNKKLRKNINCVYFFLLLYWFKCCMFSPSFWYQI